MPTLTDTTFNARLHVSAPAIVDTRRGVDRPFARVPGIQRIDLGSLLEIFKIALSVSDKTAVEDVLSALPRGYLGLVCRAWHRLILKHHDPSLWTTIVVHPHSHPSEGSWDSAPFATYLLRSRNRPLSIYIIPGQSRRGSGGSKGLEWVLADAVSKVGKRIQSLLVEARWKSSLDRLGNVLDAQLYPILKRLSINAAIDDTGPSDVTRLTANGRSALTTLSIDAKHLLTLLSSFRNFHLHRPLGRLTSLTIVDVLPNAPGFPEDGMGRIIDLANSLPRLSSLTFNLFIALEGSLKSEHWRRRSATPLSICLVTLKNSNAPAIKYLLHHLAPKRLTLDACKFTTTSIIRLPACIDSLTLNRIGGIDVEHSVLPMVASFVGSHLVVRDCAFFTHDFLHRVHGRAHLNLMGFAFPGLRRLHIESCPRMRADELLDFLVWRASVKAAHVAEGGASGQQEGERTHQLTVYIDTAL
ncbi:hypothetical protein DFP72DRAFT_1050784 [Ephemerocybe angulata]|uniref:Uncharacterized protein n=1 Tax=Ephemerocybe angulata TaxID=980116 RepID=A0A8H6HG16_9AGAR|nr:hypothetical protein DFP72DRAFT_1050784 [Tulosesus angulatus]